jgi:hypothetical protein
MFARTSTQQCPWVIIRSDDKKRARINTIRHLLGESGYPKDFPDMLGVDPRIVRTVQDVISTRHQQLSSGGEKIS